MSCKERKLRLIDVADSGGRRVPKAKPNTRGNKDLHNRATMPDITALN